MKRSNKGFTLVEILISLFIMSIMLTALVKLMSTTFKGMRNVTQSTELVTEGQLAAPMIADRLQTAICIFRVGTALDFESDPTHYKNIDTGSGSSWVVGNDPILAMFLPPSSDDPAGTYRFFAYYPTPRTNYLATNPIGPYSDGQNDSFVWMLLEYRHTIALPSKPVCSGNEAIGGGDTSRYLADFVAPTNDINIPYPMFEYNIPLSTATDQRHSVTFNIRFRRNNGGRVETVPNDGTLLSTTVYPRNISYLTSN